MHIYRHVCTYARMRVRMRMRASVHTSVRVRVQRHSSVCTRGVVWFVSVFCGREWPRDPWGEGERSPAKAARGSGGITPVPLQRTPGPPLPVPATRETGPCARMSGHSPCPPPPSPSPPKHRGSETAAIASRDLVAAITDPRPPGTPPARGGVGGGARATGVCPWPGAGGGGATISLSLNAASGLGNLTQDRHAQQPHLQPLLTQDCRPRAAPSWRARVRSRTSAARARAPQLPPTTALGWMHVLCRTWPIYIVYCTWHSCWFSTAEAQGASHSDCGGRHRRGTAVRHSVTWCESVVGRGQWTGKPTGGTQNGHVFTLDGGAAGPARKEWFWRGPVPRKMAFGRDSSLPETRSGDEATYDN